MFTRAKKVISMLIVFVIVFTYSGQTLYAIASSDGISAITAGFFSKGEMDFKAYFEGENKEKISNVNEKAVLMFEIAPNQIGKGFLKEGIIEAFGLDGSDNNFKFSKITNVAVDVPVDPGENDVGDNVPVDPEENNVEVDANIDPVEENNDEMQENNENNVEVDDPVDPENEMEENNENHVEVDDSVDPEENNVGVDDPVDPSEVVSRANEGRNEENSEEISEEFVDEEKIIEEAEKEETYEELTATDFEIEIINDNQIKVQNVIYNTKIEVEIEYTNQEEININDLYKEIEFKLAGTYINVNLEKIETEATDRVKIGWEYSKEIEVEGEYTQFSPFKLGEHQGILVESKIKVNRTVEEENYLPLKQTKVEIEVPEYHGKKPESVTVQASKLMATKGQDLGEVEFSQENWNYDAETGKVTIVVTNEKEGKAINALGEDEYVVVYNYHDYTEDASVQMDLNVRVETEEYSAENKITTKEFHTTQEIQTQVNNFITYHIATTEDVLNKAKINANYNQEETLYETEFISTVNVNLLTNDKIEELKINSAKDEYVDSNGTCFDATNDIYYNKVKFEFSEIKTILQNGGSIEIQNKDGILLYALTDEAITSQENCEINLGSKEHGISVVFRNMAVNGNIHIEFTKAIGKSSFDKAAFANFREIKSYAGAEMKYANYEERYGMAEIFAIKKLQDSKTVAEISLNNNNLSTIAKNEGVEIKIALNNDKQDTDLYSNPSFELVFPKYVKNVTVESMNMIYAMGLRIADFHTYTENDIVKMRIELEGVQKSFCESQITNGTNIILNLNIELDEYTPKKVDQIKMYYCNEGVTNYESQTKWTISKPVPNGILKQTNGFDVATINYQAPNGVIIANTMINYDGQASKIKSVNQGEKTAEIKAGRESQIATMELIAMNNTDNACTDMVFLGRIPFQGNKSVVSKKDLGTTASTKMLGKVQENIQNPNMVTIYYSTNGNASKDLDNKENGWTTEVTDWQVIQSYMIVVKGEMAKGTVLRYTYDFEIPGNLDYEQEIYGSFGGYYNNHYESQIAYESTEADKVGVKTGKLENEDQSDTNQINNTQNEEEEELLLEIDQICSANESVFYYDEMEYNITIYNDSNVQKEINVEDNFPEEFNVTNVKIVINGVEKYEEYPTNQFRRTIALQGNDIVQIIASGRIIDWKNRNQEKNISNVVQILSLSGEKILSSENSILIKSIEAKDEGEKQGIQEGEYSLSGNVWNDKDGDNVRNGEEQAISDQVQVQLMKGSSMIKATTTDSLGNYSFTGLKEGDYSVIFNYDKNKYTSTAYAEKEESSQTLEVKEGTAVTDIISLTNTDITNVNSGLQEKDNFDLSMKQYITKAIVEIDGEETEYAYEDLELAQLQIKPSDLKKANVKFEYKLVIENVGNVDGEVTSIVDYLPNGLYFDEKENPGWSRGVNGNVYTDLLKGMNFAPGEIKEITLILSKPMTEDNTGVVSNKAQIAYTQSSSRLTEGKENNFATQETIVTVTQGRRFKWNIIENVYDQFGWCYCYIWIYGTNRSSSN